MKKFDIAVLGAGPGGYVAAIRAAQSGRSVALIEKGYIGGTCLNRGCIPSKALLANAEVLHKIRRSEEFGITVGDISFDYSKMHGRKQKVVKDIRESLERLIKSNQITIFRGSGKFISPREIKITGDTVETISATYTIIATGSEPMDSKAFPCDFKKVHNSTSILELTALPKSLAIIGGGFIGCEFASLFTELGVHTTIIEMLPEIVATEGKDVSKALASAFEKKKIDILTNTNVKGVDHTESGVTIRLEGGTSIEVEMALVAIGRRLNTSDIGLEKAGIDLTKKESIATNDKMETQVNGIYAIGDITGEWLLAHVASHQGLVAARNACGENVTMHYNAVPSVIYTEPEIATVGLTLEKALEKGYTAAIGKYPFQALGKSQATGETDGFAQVVIDKKTGQVLGGQVVGYGASSLIAEVALAIHNELTAECITDTIHAHPTIAEALPEAVFIARESPLHYPPKKAKAKTL